MLTASPNTGSLYTLKFHDDQAISSITALSGQLCLQVESFVQWLSLQLLEKLWLCEMSISH